MKKATAKTRVWRSRVENHGCYAVVYMDGNDISFWGRCLDAKSKVAKDIVRLKFLADTYASMHGARIEWEASNG